MRRSSRLASAPITLRALTALLGVVVLGVTPACGGGTHEPGDPLRTAPSDVDAALIVPSLARLQSGAVGFLDGLPGASGVLELIAERYGIELRTPDGLLAIGVEPSRGAAVWTRGSAVVVAVSVRDAKAFGAHVEERIVLAAGGRKADPDAAPSAWEAPRIFVGPMPPGVASGPATSPAWRAAWAVAGDGVGILVLTAGDGDPAALVQQAANERGGLIGASIEQGGRYAKAKATAGDDAVLYMIVRDLLPASPDGLGMIKGFVDNIRGGLAEWQGGVVLTGERLALRIASDFTGEGELPVTWVTSQGAADVLAKALPKTTSALVRVRLNLGKLRALPGFILSQVLPDQIPGLEMLPIPALPDVIELIEGDIGIAFLGIEPKATFGHLTSLRALRERALETFRVAIVARLRDDPAHKAATTRQFAGIADQLAQSGWVVAALDPAQAGGWSGWTFVRGATTYSVLIDDKVVVFIVGPGEVDAFIAAKAGRATTLAEYGQGFDATLKEALGLAPAGGGTALGLSLGFLRVTRELADKGVPPFFLKMLSRIRLVGLSLDAGPKRVTLAFEVAR